jgi:hypothetical protein
MDLTPELMQRYRHDDIEDVASDFVEQELGRFDWRNNWETAKKNGTALPRIRAWLTSQNSSVHAEDISEWIDTMARDRPGRWQ